MHVKAAEGTRCPMEGKPREYITDGKAVDVPDTPYYRRLVRDGSLVVEPRQKTPPRPAVKGRSGGKKE